MLDVQNVRANKNQRILLYYLSRWKNLFIDRDKALSISKYVSFRCTRFEDKLVTSQFLKLNATNKLFEHFDKYCCKNFTRNSPILSRRSLRVFAKIFFIRQRRIIFNKGEVRIRNRIRRREEYFFLSTTVTLYLLEGELARGGSQCTLIRTG